MQWKRFVRVVLCCAMGAPVVAQELLKATLNSYPAPERFADHRPEFRWENIQRKLPGSEKTKRLWILWDHDRCIAIWGLGHNQWTRRINWITQRPGEGFTKVELEKHLHRHVQRFGYDAIWSREGVQLLTGPVIGSSAAMEPMSRERMSRTDTSASLESQGWATLKDESDHNIWSYTYRFTFTVDPVHGYVLHVDRDVQAQRDQLPPKAKEGITLDFPHGGGMHEAGSADAPWPYTLWTPPGTDGVKGFQAFANTHRMAVERENSPYAEGPGRFVTMAPGGWHGFGPDGKGWMVVWSRLHEPKASEGEQGKRGFTMCPLFLEHNPAFQWQPSSQREGWVTIRAVDRVLALAPETVEGILSETTTVEDDRQVITLPIGELENFESQPHVAHLPVRGLRLDDATLSTTHAFSGSKSIRLDGLKKPPTKGYAPPPFRLDPNTTYTFSAMVKVIGEHTTAYMQSFGHMDPNERASVKSQSANGQSSSDWQELRLTIRTGPDDLSIEPRLRLVVLGEGVAYFDDVRFGPGDASEEEEKH